MMGFALDMDGTLYLGDNVYEGAVELMEDLPRLGKKYIYLTNNSSRAGEDYITRLRRLGFPCERENVFTSGMATGMYLNQRHPGAKVYLAGTKAFYRELVSYGIDLVNEEDKSRPLIEFADQLDGIKKENPDLHIMLHAGESLYADSDNVIDAYLLGTERIGHGLNLYRFPEIMDLVREDGICLEVCPISNQALEYVEDLRGHPATEYLKRGLPISICSDDPAYLEHATLTDDFFAAIVCWDLGLAEIKQLCLNSITYSAMDDLQKEELMQSWQKQWDTFLNDQEAVV